MDYVRVDCGESVLKSKKLLLREKQKNVSANCSSFYFFFNNREWGKDTQKLFVQFLVNDGLDVPGTPGYNVTQIDSDSTVFYIRKL